MNFHYKTLKVAPLMRITVNQRVSFSNPRYADAIRITKWNVTAET